MRITFYLLMLRFCRLLVYGAIFSNEFVALLEGIFQT